jgi:hypothetical protein
MAPVRELLNTEGRLMPTVANGTRFEHDYAETFVLTPIGQETLTLVMDQ